MLSTVTLSWDLADMIESGLSATLSITPTAQMSDSADHILIPPVARTYTFTGGAGSLAGIVANDNDSILPAGTGYLISVTASSGQVIVPQFQTQLLTANGATQWLDALAVVPVVATAYQYLPLPSGTAAAGDVPIATGAGEASAWGPQTGGGEGGSGTVTTVSVATANGFAGTVANPTTTPAVTLKTTANGLLKGNSTTGVVSAAAAGTDYLAPAGSGAALTGITATQVGADASGAAATAQSNAETFATGAVATETTRAETAEALLAPLASPALTGTPTAPTQTALNNSTRLATTAYADAAVGVETSRAETAEALKAPLASPALTGSPTAPTQTTGDSSTKIATDAFVATAVATETTRAEAAEALLVPLSDLPLSIAHGGSGQITQQLAINALAGAVTSAQFLRGNGTNVSMSAIQAGDVPTLNQSTSGNAATATTAAACSGNAATATNLAGGATVPAWLAPTVTTLSFVGSGTTLVNAALGNVFALTLTASTTTLGNPSSPVDGQPIRVRIIQDATGSRTLAYGTAWDFGAAGSPTLSTAANAIDYIVGEYNATKSKWCVSAALGY